MYRLHGIMLGGNICFTFFPTKVDVKSFLFKNKFKPLFRSMMKNPLL